MQEMTELNVHAVGVQMPGEGRANLEIISDPHTFEMNPEQSWAAMIRELTLPGGWKREGQLMLSYELCFDPKQDGGVLVTFHVDSRILSQLNHISALTEHLNDCVHTGYADSLQFGYNINDDKVEIDIDGFFSLKLSSDLSRLLGFSSQLRYKGHCIAESKPRFPPRVQAALVQCSFSDDNVEDTLTDLVMLNWRPKKTSQIYGKYSPINLRIQNLKNLEIFITDLSGVPLIFDGPVHINIVLHGTPKSRPRNDPRRGAEV